MIANNLEELRAIAENLFVEAQRLAESRNEEFLIDQRPDLTVVVLDGEKLLCCFREDKPEDSIEVFRIKRIDGFGGPTSKRHLFYLAKLSQFLERRDLYPKQERY